MDKLAEQFAEIAKQYSPTVIEAAKNAVIVEAYSTIVSGVVTLTAALVAGRFSYQLYKNSIKEGWDEIIWLPIVILAITAFIMFFCGLWPLIDPWTWVAISHPELFIAKKALHL